MNVIRSACSRERGAWLIAIGAALLWPAGARATGPENTAVVVNGESWASLAVANEYVRLRGIPGSHVVVLDGVPSVERVDVDTFRERILWPVLSAIEKRKLTRQVDCIAYSADLPYTIDATKDLRGRKLPRLFSPIASITGLTFLHRHTLAKNPNYLQLQANRYMRRPIGRLGAKPVTAADQQRYQAAMQLIQEKKWTEAADAIAALVETYPKNNHMLYNLACCQARQGKPDEALATLRRSVDAGWMNHRHANRDDDLASIRSRKDFGEIIEGMRKVVFDTQPTRAFRGSTEWDAQGNPVAAGGERYLLSAMLAVTSGRGNSVAEALACLRRSAAADGTKPKGTIYFPKNGNVRSSARDWAFPSAVAKLKSLGIAAEIADGVLPRGKPDVAGATIGAAAFDWTASHSIIVPGAIVEHLTSFGGVLRERAGQTPLTELIRHGAAGASGTVAEPLAIAAKFPFPFVHVHYARGATLAEAFYQSVHGPYQLLVVGDPLCRPWGATPQLEADGVKAGATVKGMLTLTPKTKAGSQVAIRRYELLVDGLRTVTGKPTATLKLDTTPLADGWHELRVVAVAADAVETQGSLIVPITVNNHGRRLVLMAPSQTAVPWDTPLSLGARLTGGAEITLYHNARPLGAIHGEQGRVTVDPRRLGQGRVTLHAVGTLRDDPDAAVRSRPLELTVVPPQARPAVVPPVGATFAKGLRLTVDGGKPIVIDDTQSADWLAKHVKDGQTFELAGWFDVPADDVYQFQLSGNVAIELEVDGKAQKQPANEGWKFIPVHLAAGSHVLRISGKAPAKPRLDVRFGGPGCYRLSGKRFSHVQERSNQ